MPAASNVAHDLRGAAFPIPRAGPVQQDIRAAAFLARGSNTYLDVRGTPIPASSVSAVTEHTVAIIPSSVHGAPADHTSLDLVGSVVALLRVDGDSADLLSLDPVVDEVIVSRIRRIGIGSRKLWADDFTTAITIGGGASQGTIFIAREGVGQGAVFSFGPTLEGTGISSEEDLTLTASVDLYLRSLGVNIPINQASDTTLDAPFTATTVVGALNELETLPRPDVGNFYTNNTGSQIDTGKAVYISGKLEVSEADATSDTAPSRVLGAMEADTPDTATARVIVEGVADCYFAAGEGIGPHEGLPAYLSTTAGNFTLTPPAGSGNVVIDVGVVIDDTSYSNATGGTMVILLKHGNKRVLP